MTEQSPTAAQTEAEIVDSIVAAATGFLTIQPYVQALGAEVADVISRSPDFRVQLDWNPATQSGRLLAIAIDGSGEATHVLRTIDIAPPAKRVEH